MKIKAIFLYGFWALFFLALSAACSRMELEPSANGEGGVAAEPEKPRELISIMVGNPWGDDADNAGDNAGEGQGEPGTPGEPGESGEPEAPQESGEPQESGDPEESGELEEGTKILYTYESNKLKQTWEEKDELLICGNSGNSEVFTCDGVINGRGHFTGYAPKGANTSYDIIVRGRNNTSIESLKDMENICFNEMTQTNNNSFSHLKSYIWLKGVNTYWDIEFSQEWAEAHGGSSNSFNMNPMIHFRIKVPSGRTPKKIGLVSTSKSLIPHYKGGRKVNSIWLFLNSVTPDPVTGGAVFEAWMPLPEALGAGNYAVSVLLDNNYYYLTQDFYSGGFASGTMYKIQRDLTLTGNHPISGQKYFVAYNAHAQLTSGTYPLHTGGSFNDWDNRIMYAHPLLETCTLPANPKYDKLREVRVIGDYAWIYGYMEFTMYGYNQSLPFDMVFASAAGGASFQGLGSGGDGQWAFKNTNIDHFFEISGLTQPDISYNATTYNKFNNWRADNISYTFPSTYDNRFVWHQVTGTGNLYSSLNREYYSAAEPNQLTVHYVQAAGDYGVKETNVARLEFRMRRSTLHYTTNTSFAFGMKLMGNSLYDAVQAHDDGWYCHGLLPQGGKDASGNRTVVYMRTVTIPPYGDNYIYPFTSYEANIATCYE